MSYQEVGLYYLQSFIFGLHYSFKRWLIRSMGCTSIMDFSGEFSAY